MSGQLFNCDVMLKLKELPDACMDFVWADADYNVGIDYDGVDYTMEWNKYIDWYCELARESMRVLKSNGNAFFMNYPKQNAYLRVKCLDDISYDVQDYIWVYNVITGQGQGRFSTSHRSILHARKSIDNKYYKENYHFDAISQNDKRIRARETSGVNGRSWFHFNIVKNVSKEKTFHPCQIPQDLFNMFLQIFTQPNDKVFILFGGSGGELLVCEDAKRDWISCELHKPYCELIERRLKEARAVKKLF